jgi:hypothetical protein
MASSEAAVFYRLYASHCLEIAQDTAIPERKGALLDMAQAWLMLAEQADKNSDVVLVYETPTPRPTAIPTASQHLAQQQPEK